MTRGGCAAWRFGLLLSVLGAAGCYDVHTVDPGHRAVPIVANESGWVAADTNPLGLAGVWYSYGDQYPTIPRCTDVGLHPADEGFHGEKECSFVAWPDPRLPEVPDGGGNFPSSGNRLCTYGNAAKVQGCDDTILGCGVDGYDYANMWGAGIGLELRLPGDDLPLDAGPRTGWDAPGHGVIGVAFDLEWTDPSVKVDPFMRVEFPVVLPPDGLLLTADTIGADGKPVYAGETLPPGSSSEVHPSGSPFMDAPAVWAHSGVPNDPSLVVVGHNEVVWSEVKGAPSNGSDYAYAFHPQNLLGIQFHVPAINDSRIPYGFCVSNLAFLSR